MDLARGKYWDTSWNPVDGCTPASEGCRHCWAREVVTRFLRPDFHRLRFHTERLHKPAKIKRPSVIFACDLTDWCHPDFRPQWVDAMLHVMAECPRHFFLLLTKRPERIREQIYGPRPDGASRFLAEDESLDNVGLGITAETHQRWGQRWTELMGFSPAWDFLWLSAEPLLGPLNINPQAHDMGKLAWLVAGAESRGGRPGRRCQTAWLEDCIPDARHMGAPLFIKQGHQDGRLVRAPEVAGRRWLSLPASIRRIVESREGR